jgi:DNA-binding winged helix-turn-helix (wHTH) protein
MAVDTWERETRPVGSARSTATVVRYRFGEFTLSRQRRLLVRDGRDVPLIPRYFDLLLLLIERRREAVHRREIFDQVWADVIVSDSALSQAVRTLRRTLGDDDPREPRFIRTVSRHGYQFVWPDVVEEEDGGLSPSAQSAPPPTPQESPAPIAADAPAFEPLLERISRAPSSETDEDRREAAELLHALGTAEALRRLGTRPGHAAARALLREARWNSPGAGPVPVFGEPAPLSVTHELLRLRLRRAARLAAQRWTGASTGGAIAGIVAGGVGGLLLAAAPGSTAPMALTPVLAVIGGGSGALGGAGVGAGLALAEASIRSHRVLTLTAAGALGGGVVGAAVQWLARWGLAALVGIGVQVGGGVEGLLIGGAAGLGFAIATRSTQDGLAAPRGRKRWQGALVTAVICGLAGLALTLAGRPLAGGTIHAIADAAQGSRATLAPLGRLIGEPDFGPLSQAILGFGEAGVFGLGLAFGLMRRPRGPDEPPARRP